MPDDYVGDSRQHVHSWQRYWDYQNPPQPTDDQICGTCHQIRNGTYVPPLADPTAVKEWLNA